MTDTPATQRLEALHERQHEIHQEMRGSQDAGPDGFDNQEWLIAEAYSIGLEIEQLRQIMNADGEIPYAGGHDDPADPDNYD